MMGWVGDIVPQGRQPARSGVDGEYFNNIAQCSIRLMNLTSEATETDSARAGSVWPFIRKIMFVFTFAVLDLNSARQNVTERYVRNCHQVFVASYIGRATTDVRVREVFELARRANLSNVGIICTKSDAIRSDEARRDWPREIDRIITIEEVIESDSQDIASLRGEIEDLDPDDAALSAEEERELNDLYRKLRRAEYVFQLIQGSAAYIMLRRSRARHRFELQQHIITIGNCKISDQLQRRYRNHPAGGSLKVFCVSNTTYWGKRDEHSGEALPFLHLSGILDLRRYCISIIAESHLRATKKYYQGRNSGIHSTS
ncbi:hypothetical protein K469DRAFT_695311 [Zopfia rhizophila CBS 207.26]|uniref:P-loop containing nucleoside triphosphate hydrolase protein n=1 Tax=Zopfia rhizophila CBS 207.26 TaxID=1314779 RepID=A0A6A6DLL3_9PEZI|nr:hypothetical protein K469DRAFT_695311 [Zopfia rhizophila CBS 207.26]